MYYTPSGKVWSGEYHINPNSGTPMAGSEHQQGNTLENDPNPHFPLVASKIKNLKVQDMRVKKRVESFLPSILHDIKNNLAHKTLKNMSVNHLSQDPINKAMFNATQKNGVDTNEYISPPMITHDPLGNPRFVFSLDMIKLIKENFIFGKLLSRTTYSGALNTQQIESDVFSYNPIKKIQVTRQKIKNGVVQVDSPEAIIATGEPMSANSHTMTSQMFKAYNTILAHETSKYEIQYGDAARMAKLIDLGAHDNDFPPYYDPGYTGPKLITDEGTITDISKDLKLNSSARKTRTFTVVDLSAKRFPNQDFKYKVKILFEDTTLKVAKETLEHSLTNRQYFDLYMNLVQSPNMYDIQSESLTENFLALHKDTALGYAQKMQTSFNKIMRFIRGMTAADNPSSLFGENLSDSLFSFIHPYSATPNSIRAYLEIYDALLSIVKDATGLKNFTKTDSDIDGSVSKIKVDSSGYNGNISLEFRLERGSENFLTSAAKKRSEVTYTQPLKHDMFFDMFESSLGTSGFFLEQNYNDDIKFGSQYPAYGLFSTFHDTEGAGYSNYFAMKYIKNEIFSFKGLTNLRTFSADEFLNLYDKEMAKFFLKKDHEYYAGMSSTAAKYSFDPSKEGTYYQDNGFYFTPSFISKYIIRASKTFAAPYKDRSDARGVPLNNALIMGIPSANEHKNNYFFKIGLCRFIEMLYQKVFSNENELMYPKLSHMMHHLHDDTTPAKMLSSATAKSSNKNLAYIIAQVAADLGFSPNQSLIGDIAKAFQDQLIIHDYGGDPNEEISPDELTRIQNIKAQFLNEAVHTDLDEATNLNPGGFGEGFTSERLEFLTYIVLCVLFQKITNNNNITTRPEFKDFDEYIEGLYSKTIQIANTVETPHISFYRSQFDKLPPQLKYLYFSKIAEGDSGLNTGSYISNQLAGGENNQGISIGGYDPETGVGLGGRNVALLEPLLTGLGIFQYVINTSIYEVLYATAATTIVGADDINHTIKNAKFTALTNSVINNSAGKTLLCKLKRYRSSFQDAIVNTSQIDMDLIDEYFMIEVPTLAANGAVETSEDPVQEPVVINTGSAEPQDGDDAADIEDQDALDAPDGSNTGGYQT